MALLNAAGDHVCPKCRDSGYLNNTPLAGHGQAFGPLAWQLAAVPVDHIAWCDCPIGRAWRGQYVQGLSDFSQVRIDNAFAGAGIPPRFAGLTFDTIPAGHREGKEQAIAAARQFAADGWAGQSNGKRKAGLCFVGRPGVGKTGLLSIVFRARLAVGESGLWIELYAFFGEIQGQYGKPGGDADAKIAAAQRAALLLLDDCGDPDRRAANGGIGAETDDRRRILWEILDYRHGHAAATLITSNLSRSDFEAQWGTRLAVRAWELCRVVPVGGADLREVIP